MTPNWSKNCSVSLASLKSKPAISFIFVFNLFRLGFLHFLCNKLSLYLILITCPPPMRLIYRLLALVLITYCYMPARAQSRPSMDSYVKAIDSTRLRLPAERLFLHLNKPNYTTGDTIWFKAYLLNADLLTSAERSGILYVELDDIADKCVKRMMVPMAAGLTWGNIALDSVKRYPTAATPCVPTPTGCVILAMLRLLNSSCLYRRLMIPCWYRQMLKKPGKGLKIAYRLRWYSTRWIKNRPGCLICSLK